ncbi:unnamed protein product [Cuscuta campestris]|uniref:Uncharacterized protein n=1 Tax=Cuscuta campestris TaxID=132261 RepID=A0A484NL94_9ASTE|nr:unnamed protein product [Cuscuta campestris]
MDPNLFRAELNHLIGRKGLFNVVVKSEGGSPHWTGPRSFGVRSFIADPRILKKYEHLVEEVVEEPVEDETEDLWNSLEDLSQKVGEVVSNSLFNLLYVIMKANQFLYLILTFFPRLVQITQVQARLRPLPGGRLMRLRAGIPSSGSS